ncbi:DUF6049 family protein [Candidatus Aquiluna sp. UB-MaderosW2red]|uniref:DUF6049 family protein n=1 Tax=Candidatus Aquiluna sp. UB-MaderosW2red TaxID=1855377 RepID=UPI000875DC74|nr:DUF6049 family protein [Candidatus Aquiluna sp. UB-MaderosW2red]SCX04432.1 hypothetical protein SAMN05216534_0256 [Candidatus Aquiluna sp. UB-MaderosW2red]
MRRIIALLATLLVLGPAAQAEDAAPQIVPGSTINLVARDGRIPVTIENPTDQDLELTLQGRSGSFRLEVVEGQSFTVAANSSQLAELSVRAIANGPVEITIWLEQSGLRVGQSQLLNVNVNYDIELFLLVTLGVGIVALISVGAIRTIVKLRRAKNE